MVSPVNKCITRLTICIPTYNFGRFIGQTLDSILPQVTDEVEVIVLDGGSTDETEEVVLERQKNYESLTYYYQNFRGGIDCDIEKVVSLAKGKYCWLFSADDIMLPNSVNKILEAINSEHDVYLCEHELCNLEMEIISEYPLFNNIIRPKLFNLADEEQRRVYFSKARTSEVFFSFMSGPIFKKKVWDNAVVDESFRGTCWIVAGHLLRMIPKGISVYYLCETLLQKRGGNDSFSDRGIVNRCRIAIETFQHVGNTIFGKNSEEAFHIRRVLKFDVTLSLLLYAKLKTAELPSTEDINILNRIAKKHYADKTASNVIKYVIYRMSHINVLRVAAGLKKKLWNSVIKKIKLLRTRLLS